MLLGHACNNDTWLLEFYYYHYDKRLIVKFLMLLQDGTANYLKGLMLVLCYLIVAASFYVHVDSPQ